MKCLKYYMEKQLFFFFSLGNYRAQNGISNKNNYFIPWGMLDLQNKFSVEIDNMWKAFVDFILLGKCKISKRYKNNNNNNNNNRKPRREGKCWWRIFFFYWYEWVYFHGPWHLLNCGARPFRRGRVVPWISLPLEALLPRSEGSASGEAEGVFRRVCSQKGWERLVPGLMASNSDIRLSMHPALASENSC